MSTETETITKAYTCQNRQVVVGLTKASAAWGKVQVAEASAMDIIRAIASDVSTEYFDGFAKWCERNSIRHTMVEFIVRAVDPGFPRNRDAKDGIPGYYAHPLYFALSKCLQTAKNLKAQQTREAALAAKTAAFTAAGMDAKAAAEKAASETPQEAGTRGAEATSLGLFKKALAGCYRALQAPDDLIKSHLRLVGIGDKTAEQFTSKVLPTFVAPVLLVNHVKSHFLAPALMIGKEAGKAAKAKAAK